MGNAINKIEEVGILVGRPDFQKDREEPARQLKKLKCRSSLRKYSPAVKWAKPRKLAAFFYVARELGSVGYRQESLGGKIPS